jgi:hypothetical protein
MFGSLSVCQWNDDRSGFPNNDQSPKYLITSFELFYTAQSMRHHRRETILQSNQYRVFDIDSESRSPPRVAINDQNCKKPHIHSLFLVEVRLMFSMPAQITARSSHRSRQRSFIHMTEQRHVTKFFGGESLTGIEIHQHLIDHYGNSAISRSEVCRRVRDIKRRENGPRNDFKFRNDARRRTFPSNPTPDRG